ncbi:hypothetical protein OSSY52_19870 [Tepiditoga spiralis]|uniref:HEAT repeat domain-containing protein n=1 Tax=Tepiditoga spiralis TaxID=2108365 RepID=A0A7G1G8T6_9BACT|nr:hypothetical protein [Tepiditoga spiralis]BBE31846.1 hypothetical protein OSSY52_19870 [Tepiditoga spiralis]
MYKEDIIQKIVEEKGIEAIPNLVKLLEDSDPDTRELARDVIGVMGESANEYLFEDFKKRFDKNLEDDMVMLYLAEILSQNGYKEIIPYLERMINNYTDERAFPIIVEHLWRLTKEERYLDILTTFLDDDDAVQEIAIMGISHVPTKKGIDVLVDKYNNSKENSSRALILDSILQIIINDFKLVPYLQEKDREIANKLRWHWETFK